eukprot:1625216-Pleurochrysis_carterae.AAC.1
MPSARATGPEKRSRAFLEARSGASSLVREGETLGAEGFGTSVQEAGQQEIGRRRCRQAALTSCQRMSSVAKGSWSRCVHFGGEGYLALQRHPDFVGVKCADVYQDRYTLLS